MGKKFEQGKQLESQLFSKDRNIWPLSFELIQNDFREDAWNELEILNLLNLIDCMFDWVRTFYKNQVAQLEQPAISRTGVDEKSNRKLT